MRAKRAIFVSRRRDTSPTPSRQNRACRGPGSRGSPRSLRHSAQGRLFTSQKALVQDDNQTAPLPLLPLEGRCVKLQNFSQMLKEIRRTMVAGVDMEFVFDAFGLKLLM